MQVNSNLNDDFMNSLKDHKVWVKTLGQDGKRLMLQDFSMSNCDLSESILSQAELPGIKLTNVVLAKADCYSAFFGGAELLEVDFSNARLGKAKFEVSTIRDSNLFSISAMRSNFFGSKMQNVRLVNSNLRFAYFMETQLENVDLTGCDLTGASLSNAVIKNVNFTNVIGAKDIICSELIVWEKNNEIRLVGQNVVDWISSFS